MKRVLVVGNAGSGKSTAAKMIGEALGLPAYHMDRDVFWLPNWEERSKEDQVEQVKRIVAMDKWVFEGNNSRTFDIREARAEMLIWLDLPLLLRLWRVTKRAFLYSGQTRPDMAEGCNEQLNMLPSFWHFIISTNRESRRKQSAFFDRTHLVKHRFRSSRDFNAFVAKLKEERS